MNAQQITQPTFNTGSQNNKPTALQTLGNFLGINNDVQYDNNLNLMNRADAFNQFMSDTQYQRTVADMEKAGINPLIAFGLGKGQLDSAPTSAQASTSSNSGKGLNFVDNLMRDITRLISSTISDFKI